MTFHLTLGIDPGQTGAVAVLHDGQFQRFIDMPTVARAAGGNQIDGAGLAHALRDELAAVPGAHYSAVLEQVAAMPGQGVSSMFRFGEGYGVVQGVLAALSIPVLLVHPSRWKKAIGLTGKEKDVARGEAIRRFPAAAPGLTRKKDVGRADALLIAAWAHQTEQFGTIARRDAA